MKEFNEEDFNLFVKSCKKLDSDFFNNFENFLKDFKMLKIYLEMLKIYLEIMKNSEDEDEQKYTYNEAYENILNITKTINKLQEKFDGIWSRYCI